MVHSFNKPIPGLTNNEAEYEALIAALKLASQFEVDKIEIMSDSELLIKQLNGIYKVRNPRLARRMVEIRSLAKDLPEVEYQHIPRQFNSFADKLARMAMETIKHRNKHSAQNKRNSE